MTTIGFNLAELKRAARPVLGFTPTGHNDGGTLWICVGVERDKADKLAELLTVPGTTTSVSKSERLGSFASQEAWKKSGQAHEYYLLFTKP